MKKNILAIVASTVWISISEFVRNSFLLHKYWISLYQKIGFTFPEQGINGAVWGIWSLCFAVQIYILSKKFTLAQTTFFAWFIGFISMWLVTGNLGVLPFEILPFAIPLSLFESFLASYIIFKLSKK